MTREQAEAKAAELNAEYDRALERLASLSLPEQYAVFTTLTRTYVSQEAGRPGGYRTRSARAHLEANARYYSGEQGFWRRLREYKQRLRARITANKLRLAALEEELGADLVAMIKARRQEQQQAEMQGVAR